MITVQLTNGFGNNLFQCITAKLLATYLEQEVAHIPPSAGYYGIEELRKTGLEINPSSSPPPKCQMVTETNYTHFFNKQYSNTDLFVSGYFENYKFYKNNVGLIRSWFNKIPDNTKNKEDLVMHFRAGDRLFYANEFESKPQAKSFTAAIERFDFEKLNIVTDMPYWKHITVSELENMKFHVKIPSDIRVSPQRSVDYFNSIVDAFAKYEPRIEK